MRHMRNYTTNSKRIGLGRAAAGAFAGLLLTSHAIGQESEAPAAEAPAAPAAEAPAAAGLESEEKKISYIIGNNIGQNIKQDNLDLDIDAFVRGLEDVLEEREPALSEEEMMTTMQAFQQKMMAEQQQEMAAEAEENAAAALAFLTENSERDEVTTTESGLQYEVLEEGDGERPASDDTVTVHYTGSLIDGTVFDSSVERGQPANFAVDQVIPGWTEALQLMPAGSKWRLYIPSDLAYGDQGAGGGAIGPNETLIFEVELIEIE